MLFLPSPLLQRLLFPKSCVHCGRLLVEGEETLCLICQPHLPRMHAGAAGNAVENYLFGRLDFVHATSFFRYSAQSAHLIRAAKYQHKPWINRGLAHLFATELQQEGWPHDIDVLVPVPIHFWRRLTRGYNQAYHVALGLAEVWHLPIESSCLKKHRYTSTQVELSFNERLEHEKGSFIVQHAERLENKHILLVDDVLTSGATLEACAIALRQSCPFIRISILTLAFAHQ